MTLRAFLLASVLIGVAVGGTIAGVRAFVGESAAPVAVAPAATPVPTPLPAGEESQAVAERFAAAWERDDLAAMYDLLAPPARSTYPFAVFSGVYANFSQETAVERLEVWVGDVDAQRATLRVRLETAYFGDLEYTTVIHIAPSEEGLPRLNWTRAAVHPALGEGAEFRGELRRPRRGNIYDRNGEPLALTSDTRIVGLDRSLVLNEATVSDALVGFGFERGEVAAAFASPLGPRQRVPIGVVPDSRIEEGASLAASTPGVLLWFEAQRTHPLGPAAAHVVGYTREYTAEELVLYDGTGLLPGDRLGAVGIEAAMDAVLAGKIGARLEIVGGAEPVVLYEREFVPGADVHTTLDAEVLRASHAGLSGQRGAAVVLDPQTNAILALNSSPSYDPDAFERGDASALAAITADEGQPLANRATHGLYSAGSTFKLVTGAAGLASGNYTTTDRIFCGAIWYGVDPPRRNWEGVRGLLTIAEGLQRSCNTLFYEVALTLYNTTDGALSDMARAFGYGAETGVVGIFEEPGLVPDAAWKVDARGEPWYPGDAVNLGIGQGDLLITPLQLANAYGAITVATLRSPTILAGAEATDRGALPLTEEEVAYLRYGLELVADFGGTAAWAFANQGYRDFAGKSGTAEDTNDQEHVLFVAYAPKAAPGALAAVVFDDGPSGRLLAAPLARDLVLAALSAPS